MDWWKQLFYSRHCWKSWIRLCWVRDFPTHMHVPINKTTCSNIYTLIKKNQRGYHGLWFDGDLLNGHTQRSKTYDNDMLTSSEYFTIAAIEVWTFADWTNIKETTFKQQPSFSAFLFFLLTNFSFIIRFCWLFFFTFQHTKCPYKKN